MLFEYIEAAGIELAGEDAPLFRTAYRKSAELTETAMARSSKLRGLFGSIDATTPVVLRIPTTMLNQIDALVKAQPIKTPRHRWMLEALYEKISREERRT